MVANMKVLTLFILLKFGCVTDGLQCYTCQHAGDVHDCNTVTTCTSHQSCLLDVTSSSNGQLYSMECADNQRCSGPSGGSLLVGRSKDQITKRLTNCLECCSTDLCNQELCNHTKPSACLDSPKVDCALMSSAFNVCGDIQHAKLFCPQYCGLCTLVDGNWSPWSSWSTCDFTCGNGTESRDRTCTDPNPVNGGLDCKGTSHEMRTCVKQSCPVHGDWSLWSSWGSCSVTCDIGMQRRDRSCSNPYPSLNGDHCFGDSRDDRVCIEQSCANWTPCPVTCMGGLRSRQRSCTSPEPSVLGKYCVGEPKMFELCNNFPCQDGHWSSWGQWSSCSLSCGSGLKTRSRSCSDPIPSTLGRSCVGDGTQTISCMAMHCPGSSFSVNTPTALGCLRKQIFPTVILTSCSLSYSHVLHSSNADYNIQTGVFTCSIPGNYIFSLMMSTGSLDSMQCDLKLNSQIYTTIIIDSHESSNSITPIIHLNTYDRLAIVNCFINCGQADVSQLKSTFSGVLITPD